MAIRSAIAPEGVPGDATSNEMIATVRDLISLMGNGGITELDLSTGDISIRLRGVAGLAAGQNAASPIPHSTEDGGDQAEDPGHEITAPMIGTFYSAPSPGEAPFVHVGDEVEVGQVVGIIEAMKIMNEIISDRAGVVVAVLVENAQAVEYGSPLIVLGDPADALA